MKNMLDEKEQKYLKGISKALYVISKIVKVVITIGIGALGFAFLILFVLFSKFDYQEGILLFDKEKVVTLEESIEGVTLHFEDSKYELVKLNDQDKINLIPVKKFLDNNGLKTVFLYVEVAIFTYCVILVVLRMIFKRLELLFNNVNTLNSPFKDENTLLLNKVITLIIFNMVISIIGSFVLGLIWNFDINFKFNLTSIYDLLVIFVLYYICKYGCALQEKSKLSIYGKESE